MHKQTICRSRMDSLLIVLVVVTASAIAIHLLSRRSRSRAKKLPPGSLGVPVIGHTLGFLRALRCNTSHRWVQDRIDRYASSPLGDDSTSMLVTFIVRQLANDPANLAAKVQEQDKIARNKVYGEPLAWEDLSKMKFTWHVAQETLRLVPPLFSIFRTAVEDLEFGGYCIPKGWQVYLSSTGTHMDPNIFPEPAKFDPSRFDSETPPCSFIPFGGGPTICPGMEFAKMGTLVTMHHLVRHFTWKLCCKDNTYSRDQWPWPSPLQGLTIQLEHKTYI